MSRWIHSRRGLIEGEDVSQDKGSEWASIRLNTDSPRASKVARGHGPIDRTDSVITVRRAFLRPVTDRENGSEHDGTA